MDFIGFYFIILDCIGLYSVLVDYVGLYCIVAVAWMVLACFAWVWVGFDMHLTWNALDRIDLHGTPVHWNAVEWLGVDWLEVNRFRLVWLVLA